ncbi:MAG: hypothetical protein ACK4N5_20550, partial [Myxococcales bacterium]
MLLVARFTVVLTVPLPSAPVPLVEPQTTPMQTRPEPHEASVVQAVQVPALHSAVVQSAFTAQVPPVAHLLLHDPPQSTSVSLPLRTPSLQVGAWHTPPEQTPETQSFAVEQPAPVPHFVVQLPPQSVPV